MQRILLAVLVFLLLPASSFAARAPATFVAERSFLAASSSPGNAYIAGASIVVTAPVAGDLSAAGGSVVAAAPVQGDELLFGGSVSARARVAGDLRALGGSITVDGPVEGDMVLFGFSVHDSGRVEGSTFIAAIDADISGGAAGPVIIYGNDISLAGDFADDVRVVASGHLTLAEGATIRGTLSYLAPELATIPSSAVVAGGVAYESASYLPDAGTSRFLVLLGVGFFLFARILGALILAGLLAGLFPRLAEMVVARAYTKRLRGTLLTMLLGFAILAATPVLLVLLSLTFVGLGLALLLFILYALLVLLSFLYAGILLGSVFVRRFTGRTRVLWRDGVLGMLALSLVALVPVVGLLVLALLMIFSAGALLQIFFSFAFPHEEHTP